MTQGLVEVDYEQVARFRRQAEREGIPLGATRRTRWFRTPGGEGFLGVIQLAPGRVRMKATYVHPEFRGRGIYAGMVTALLAMAVENGWEVEAIVTRARPWLVGSLSRRHGFTVAGKALNGNARMLWKPGGV